MSSETDSSTDCDVTAYSALVEQSTDALFVVDGTDQFAVVNEEFLSLVGYDRGRIVGANPMTILHEDDASEWERRVNLLRTDPDTESDSWVARLVTEKGTEVPAEFDLAPIENDEGVVGIVRDVREQDRQEKKLNILNRALRHNIRNRMNIVLGKATTLQDIDDDGYRTAAERIEEVGQEIINISNKARKAQKYMGIPADEDCEAELTDLTEQVVLKFSISYPDATVTTDLPARARARAPPSYEVALTELLENAVVHHSSGDGPATVSIEAASGQVTVHVDDRCDPIPEPIVETLEEGVEKPLHHNDGLGLWLVQWAVDTVDGDLSFGRRPGGDGNRVSMTFEAIEP